MDLKAKNKKVKDSIRRSKARRGHKACLTSKQWHAVLEGLRTAIADSQTDYYDGVYDSLEKQLSDID